MPFNIASQRYFKHTVKGLPDSPDGTPQSMDVTYRVLDDEAAAGADTQTADGLRAFVTAAVVEIGDLVDESRAPVPFSAEVLEALLRQHDVMIALRNGYAYGLHAAATGN